MLRNITWKLLNWSNTFSGPILMATGSATGSSAGKAMIFAKSDGKIYTKDAEGVEAEVGGAGGGGLAGTQYIFVTANGTDTENATELRNAYEAAKLMSPSSTKRITIVCGPGNYNLGSTVFTMNTQYIDLVSLDGNISVVFNSANSAGTISITANDVFVKGIDVGTKKFTIATNLNLLRVENCKGGDYSFSANTTSGTFTNCIGGNWSFGNEFGTTSGTFTNCTGGIYSFGGTGGVASGTFTNCSGSNYSFAQDGNASGTFTNCTAGFESFAASGIASGKFTNCVASFESFGTRSGTASGTFINCTAGFDSFGSYFGSTASGTFINCIAGDSSFGGGGGSLTGKLFYCRLTSGTFRTVSAGGKTRLCIDGNDTENNQG